MALMKSWSRFIWWVIETPLSEPSKSMGIFVIIYSDSTNESDINDQLAIYEFISTGLLEHNLHECCLQHCLQHSSTIFVSQSTD